MSTYWKDWIKAALVRCIKTICEAAIAMIGTSLVLADVDWKMVVSASLLAGILSVLTSLRKRQETAAGLICTTCSSGVCIICNK